MSRLSTYPRQVKPRFFVEAVNPTTCPAVNFLLRATSRQEAVEVARKLRAIGRQEKITTMIYNVRPYQLDGQEVIGTARQHYREIVSSGLCG